jgi:PAS domain S-box-containing protein
MLQVSVSQFQRPATAGVTIVPFGGDGRGVRGLLRSTGTLLDGGTLLVGLIVLLYTRRLRGAWRADTDVLQAAHATAAAERDRLASALQAATAAHATAVAEAAEGQARVAELRHLFDTMGEGLIFFDTSWRVADHNLAAERLMGLTGEEIRRGPPHKDGWAFLTVDGKPFGKMESPMGRTIATGQPVINQPVAIHMPDTSRRFFNVTTRIMTKRGLVTGPNEDPDAMVGVATTFAEITPIIESEQRLSFALEGTQDALWDWRIDTGSVHRSALWREMLGYDAADIDDSSDVWERMIHPDDLDATRRAIADALAGRTSRFDAEYRLRTKAGGWAWVHDRGVIVVRAEDGRPLRMTGSQRDVTARHEQEDALRRAKEAAEASNHAKSEFLARMSHELRTPLNSVIGFAGVLADNRKGTFAHMDLQYVRRIQNNGVHLLGIIDQILDLAKVESGHVTVEHTLLSVEEVVQTTVQQLEGNLKGKPIILSASLPPTVALAHGDESRLRQVLINLVGNAIKFTPKGEVTVHVATDPVAGAVQAIEVRDTGIGIPPDRLRAVFEPFEQVEATTTRIHGGTGLGLAISKQLCNLMGYRLDVTSVVGEGSTFRIEFPPSVHERLGDADVAAALDEIAGLVAA